MKKHHWIRVIQDNIRLFTVQSLTANVDIILEINDNNIIDSSSNNDHLNYQKYYNNNKYLLDLDYCKISQVFKTLIKNSLKFSNSGNKLLVKVSMKSKRIIKHMNLLAYTKWHQPINDNSSSSSSTSEEDIFVVEVTDQGPGISTVYW